MADKPHSTNEYKSGNNFEVSSVHPSEKRVDHKPIPEYSISENNVRKNTSINNIGHNNSSDFSVEPVHRAQTDRPTVEPVRRTQTDRPTAETVRRAQTDRPTVEPVRRAQTDRPTVEPVRRAQTDRPTVEPVRRTQADRPATENVRRAQADRPTVETVRRAQDAGTSASVVRNSRYSDGVTRKKSITVNKGNEYGHTEHRQHEHKSPEHKQINHQEREEIIRQRREELIRERREEELRRRTEIENSSSLFVKKTKQGNYFINLAIVTFKMFLVCVLIVGFSGVGFVLGMAKSHLESVPELDFTQVTDQDQATLLYGENGQVLGNYYNMENREWAEFSEVPESLQNAVIAIEDVRFRRHMGIDFKRIIASAISNVVGGSVQGGSTITQQLVKNTMLSFEQTYKRKIQEASLALELEKRYDKNDILEAYLNTIYMGGSCYGMKTAAKDYFGKDLSELSLRECACLAGMIQNPSRYNPRSNYFQRSNPQRTDNRTNLVLYEMMENGFITKEQYQEAKADTFTVLEKSPYSSNMSMTYFTDYLLDSAVDAIIEDRNLENNASTRTAVRKEIRTSGYSIYSTLDKDKQISAEQAVYNFTNYPNMRSSTDSYTVIGTNPDGSVIRLVQPQTAVAVVDYHNGHIVALVGGRQAPTGSLQYNRAYQSTMPVGSSIKPLSVYGPAIEKGKGIGSVFYDFQMRIQGWGTEADKGYPANNSRSYNNGPVQMRKAFVNSLNTTAAQALMYDVTLDTAYDYLVKLGVNPDHISKTGSGLALGSSGITPIEMAGAYTAIANMGVYIQPIAFTKIVDKFGNVVVDMEAKQKTHRVYSESTAWQITDMMRSVATSNSRTNVPGQTVYGKTGTNSDNKGVFFAGFTGYYVGCVWIGSDAYKSLVSSAQGGVYAAPLFAAVMKAIHTGLANKPANSVNPATVGVAQMSYCDISGKRATAACKSTHTEYGNPSEILECDLHRTVKICSESGGLATDKCPADKITEKTVTAIPESGILNDMYNNNHDIFVSVAGEAVIDISTCTVHGGKVISEATPTASLKP